MAHTENKKGMRFIRKNGKVIPVRSDGGVHLNSLHKVGYKKSSFNKDFKKAIDDSLIKDPKKLKKLQKSQSKRMGIFGAGLGAFFGGAAGVLFKKGKMGALVGGVGLGAAFAHGEYTRKDFIDDRRFSKSLGQSARKQLSKTGSTSP